MMLLSMAIFNYFRAFVHLWFTKVYVLVNIVLNISSLIILHQFQFFILISYLLLLLLLLLLLISIYSTIIPRSSNGQYCITCDYKEEQKGTCERYLVFCTDIFYKRRQLMLHTVKHSDFQLTENKQKLSGQYE